MLSRAWFGFATSKPGGIVPTSVSGGSAGLSSSPILNRADPPLAPLGNQGSVNVEELP
jgi:hypothetical protein